MEPVFAVSTGNGIVGWILIALGALTMSLAVAASAIEAFRKAFQKSSQISSFAAKEMTPWKDILDLLGQILKELMGKTGGPTFVMGLIITVVGILVLNEKIF